MATRIPLVIGSNGLPQQLQASDSISTPTSQTSVRQQLNGEASTAVVAGMAVYVSAAGTVKRAQANAASTAQVAFLAYDASTAAAASGNMADKGVLTLTTAQWDAVAGTTGGLTFATNYFLSATTAGMLTATAPTTVGQLNVLIGEALSTTDMLLILAPPILL